MPRESIWAWRPAGVPIGPSELRPIHSATPSCTGDRVPRRRYVPVHTFSSVRIDKVRIIFFGVRIIREERENVPGRSVELMVEGSRNGREGDRFRIITIYVGIYYYVRAPGNMYKTNFSLVSLWDCVCTYYNIENENLIYIRFLYNIMCSIHTKIYA